jgi:hypothetical protein
MDTASATRSEAPPPPAVERTRRPARALAGIRPHIADAAAAALTIVLLLAVHDIPAMIRAHYWLDEAWVALSVRLPLADLPLATASTPVGWTALLRLVPDVDRLRLLPLAFLVAAVLIAYALGRSLGWAAKPEGVLAGLAAAVGVIMLPAGHLRHDLKQYTADAAVALALITLVSVTERRWSRRRLGAIAAVTAVGMLISHATAIMAICVAGGLIITALARRQWRRLVEALVTTTVAGAAVLLVYLGVTTRGRNQSLQAYWADYFPDLDDLGEYLGLRMSELQHFIGMPWPLLLVLAAGGLLVIARTGRPATAVAVALLPVVMVVLGLTGAYPLLDLRTSHFFLVLLAALAGLGVAGAAIAGARAFGRARPAPRTAAAAVLVAAVFLTFANANRDWLRLDDPDKKTPAHETAQGDIRAGVRYIEAHRQAGDVIVVNTLGSFGFALYWTSDRPVMEHNAYLAVGWTPGYADRSRIVVVADRTGEATQAALARAQQLAAEPDASGRIWLVRTHVVPEEKHMWKAALAPYLVELHPEAGDQGIVTGIRRRG